MRALSGVVFLKDYLIKYKKKHSRSICAGVLRCGFFERLFFKIKKRNTHGAFMRAFAGVGAHVPPQLARVLKPPTANVAFVLPILLVGEEVGVGLEGVGAQLFCERKLFVTFRASGGRRNL